jgi:hypothetical protein
MLKNNFRIKSDNNKRKKNILKLARQNANAADENPNFMKRPKKKKGEKPNPFDVRANIKENPNLVANYEQDGVKNRMKRRIVRRRSQYNFEAALAQAFIKKGTQPTKKGNADKG